MRWSLQKFWCISRHHNEWYLRPVSLVLHVGTLPAVSSYACQTDAVTDFTRCSRYAYREVWFTWFTQLGFHTNCTIINKYMYQNYILNFIQFIECMLAPKGFINFSSEGQLVLKAISGPNFLNWFHKKNFPLDGLRSLSTSPVPGFYWNPCLHYKTLMNR